MQLLRMFSKEKYKGTRNYLKTQKGYEILRTVIYFAISLSLFIAGYVATKDRMNLLTVVAVLGCLPASKSAVDMIMYLRYKGCSFENAKKIEEHAEGLQGLFDMVFTSYTRNYQVAHMVVKGKTICGFTEEWRAGNFSNSNSRFWPCHPLLLKIVHHLLYLKYQSYLNNNS